MDYYLNYVYEKKKSWMWAFNKQLWPFCNPFPKMCMNQIFLASVCKIFPIQIIKTVRLPLFGAESLINDNKLNLKVLLLVRDPRGVYNSRLHQEWCVNGQDCIDLGLMCKRMVDDYKAVKKLNINYPGKLLVIRYEDLVSWPYKTTEKVFNFLNIPVTSDVLDYLKRNSLPKVRVLKKNIF